MTNARSPKGFLQAFFLNGKNFGLHGISEHKQKKISHIQCVQDPYTACVSKYHAVELAKSRVKNKVVPNDAIPEAGTRCHVYVLDCYFEKIPREAIKKDNFYVPPIVKLKDSTQPQLTTVPVGRNALSMCRCGCQWHQDQPQSQGNWCDGAMPCRCS